MPSLLQPVMVGSLLPARKNEMPPPPILGGVHMRGEGRVRGRGGRKMQNAFKMLFFLSSSFLPSSSSSFCASAFYASAQKCSEGGRKRQCLPSHAFFLLLFFLPYGQKYTRGKRRRGVQREVR